MAENKTNRLYGIDLLKITAMLMVVLLHVQKHGGILSATDSLSAQYISVRFLEYAAICAVNVYVMTTGYLYIKSEFRYKNIIRLWLQVFFYSAGIPLLLKLIGQDIGIKDLISGFFPILRSRYWFFTEYFALFFMIPALNELIRNKRLAQRIIVALVLLLSILSMLSLGNDLFKVEGGYSFLWFVVLYLCGGYVREYRIDASMSAKTAVIGYVACVFCMLVLNIGIYVATERILGEARFTELFSSYVSPFVLGSAFFLLVLFSKFRFKSKTLTSAISAISALTFGVYLIHDYSVLRAKFISGRFAHLAKLPSLALVGNVLLATCLIFASCALIEYGRAMLFRWLKVNKLADKAEMFIQRASLRITELMRGGGNR